jgi:hypothetical protein
MKGWTLAVLVVAVALAVPAARADETEAKELAERIFGARERSQETLRLLEELTPVVLHHHPYSRAANVVWMLEEVGVPYELVWVDILKGEQKAAAHRALNPMGKLPVLVDDGVAIAESAAIGVRARRSSPTPRGSGERPAARRAEERNAQVAGSTASAGEFRPPGLAALG